MATKILFLDASAFGGSSAQGQAMSVEECCKLWSSPDSGPLVTFALSRHRFDPGLGDAFEKTSVDLSCAFFQKGEDAQNSSLGFLSEEGRGLGVKAHLAKGSTVYSESFFGADGAGERLDPLFRFARTQLSPSLALDAWVSFQSFLFVALRSLHSQGDTGAGDRADVQVGADDKNFVYSVRFDLAPEQFGQFRRHPGLELPRTCASIMEIRSIRDAKKVEVTVLFPRAGRAASCVEVHSSHATSALETPAHASEYQYQPLHSLKSSPAPEGKISKGGFKKKFSSQVAAPVAESSEAAPSKAPVVAATPEVKVSGGAGLKPKEDAAPPALAQANPALVEAERKIIELNRQVTNLQATINSKESDILQLKQTLAKAPAAAAAAAAASAPSLADAAPPEWEKKVAAMEADLKAARSQIAQMGKDLTEAKDPLKRGVISNIKDTAEQGLRDNIEKLKKDLVDSQSREKELLGVLDKAVQLKDEASKKLKEYEVKLKASSGGNNSKVIQLEKQVEEQKRQNKELSKRVSEMRAELDSKAA